MNTTIKDVARLAQVSIATVSRVINQAENVMPETRERVMAAVNELGYTPNTIARSLKQKSTKTVGIIMTDLSVSFFANIVKTLEDALLDLGYVVFISNTYDNPEIEMRLIQVMSDRRVDALLISSTGRNEKALMKLHKSGLPVLLYDRRSRKYDFPSFYVDKRTAIFILLNYLVPMGHRRIAFISGERELSTNYDRFMGIQDYIYEKQLDADSITCHFGSFTPQFGRECIESLINGPNPPTAIIAGSVAIAEGIMIYCRDHGISIPGGLSLVTFGNLTNAQLVCPFLTYIDDMAIRIANEMASYLQTILDIQQETPSEPRRIIIDPKLTIGQSCTPPAEIHKIQRDQL